MSEIKEVLILTGTSAIGKTATGKAWAKSKNGVLIECNSQPELNYKKDFLSKTEEEEKNIALLAAQKATEYLQKGVSVAIDNIWSLRQIEDIRSELFRFRDLKLKTIRLICDPEENRKRDKESASENQMNERIAKINEELNSHLWPSYIKIIDNTNKTIDEVLKLIDEE